MKIYRGVALVFMLLLAASSASWAVNLSGQSRTYLQSRETADSMQLLPLFEYLDIDAQNLGSQNVAFHFGGWYRFDLRDESFGPEKRDGDLQYAYLSYRASQNNAFLNLGRMIVNQGAASEHLDGASAGADFMGGFSAAVFGGLPLETLIDTRSGDSVYGGRISQGLDGLYRIGASYVLEKNDTEEIRKEEGLDLWFRPFSKAEILGTMLYNAITSEVAQTSAYLTIGPFANLTLLTQYQDISYQDYFSATTVNAFRLSPGGLLDPNEKLAMIGEEALITVGKTNISADYKKYDYEVAGSADYFGGRIAYSGERTGSGLAYHRMEGETDDLRYSEYRLYLYGKIRKLILTADALMVNYDVAINDVQNAYSAVLAAGFPVTRKAMVGADIEYAKNPFFDKDVRGLLKLVYNFDLETSDAKNTNTKKRRK